MEEVKHVEYIDVIAWDTPEYYHIPKTSDWYWLLGILVLSVIVLCLIFNNILLAIFILLAGITVGMYAGRMPNIVHHEILPKGILVGDTLYGYDSLESFWIDEHPYQPIIILKSKKLLMPYVIIPCEGVSFADIRSLLSLHLKEVEHFEPLTYKIFEYFGF